MRASGGRARSPYHESPIIAPRRSPLITNDTTVTAAHLYPDRSLPGYSGARAGGGSLPRRRLAHRDPPAPEARRPQAAGRGAGPAGVTGSPGTGRLGPDGHALRRSDVTARRPVLSLAGRRLGLRLAGRRPGVRLAIAGHGRPGCAGLAEVLADQLALLGHELIEVLVQVLLADCFRGQVQVPELLELARPHAFLRLGALIARRPRPRRRPGPGGRPACGAGRPAGGHQRLERP